MYLSAYQLQRFRCDGFIVLPGVFSPDEVSTLRAETERLIEEPSPGLVLEADGVAARSLNGPHLISPLMAGLMRSTKLLPVAEQILHEPVYLHQYKINMKRAFVGDQWEWHSDFWFWQAEDGMRAPHAITAAIFLDDVNDFNGPTLFVPGSHESVLRDEHHRTLEQATAPGEEWRTTTARDLKYSLERSHLSREIDANGMVAAKGQAGSVLVFHCNVLHASSANASPWDRRTIFISYNRVSNALSDVASPRPEFLASRRFDALRSEDGQWPTDVTAAPADVEVAA
ncbi:MAG TPA: phytanoyl-CoA dioxygenase family protein [Luteibacter sp.]|uniref:phytanoyl-CoA dioxygenase family protein n=1 Tax=Luteibacter sp. TaxID=1886636 RepID=UPI002F40C067